MEKVPVRAVLKLFSGHGHKKTGIAADDLHCAHHKTIVNLHRNKRLQPLVSVHWQDFYLGDIHISSLLFKVFRDDAITHPCMTQDHKRFLSFPRSFDERESILFNATSMPLRKIMKKTS